MFELSPPVTAATAPASRIPASSRWSRSKPKPTTFRPVHSGGRRRRERGSLSMTATLWPSRSSVMASSDPTRPQPTTTTCTGTWNTAPPGCTTLPLRRPRVPRQGELAGKCLLGAMRSAAARIDRRAPAALPTPESLELPESLGYRIKKRLLGPPLVSEQLRTERLGKPTALAVLSSDVLSSSAYATEQILRVLVVAVGVAAFSLTVPVTLAILVVLLFVTLSYREVIWAYPKAGGAYVVSRENFGPNIAQIAGVSLLIDYTLTVAVSIAAGVSALTSAVPSLTPYTVEMSVAFVLLIAYGNLRGIREAGRFFAVPTFVVLPNMAGLILGSMVLGVSLLASWVHAVPFVSQSPTVLSQVAKFVYGTGGVGTFLYYFLQIATLFILVLAANTSFTGFPFLASFVGGDSFLPRQLTRRGHRLVFSNGIIVLTVFSVALSSEE